MIYISFMELLPIGIEDVGEFWAMITFFMGILFIASIDLIIPEVENPHDYKDPSEISKTKPEKIGMVSIALIEAYKEK